MNLINLLLKINSNKAAKKSNNAISNQRKTRCSLSLFQKKMNSRVTISLHSILLAEDLVILPILGSEPKFGNKTLSYYKSVCLFVRSLVFKTKIT